MKYIIFALAFYSGFANANSVNLVFSVNPSCYDYVTKGSCASPGASLVEVNFPLQLISSSDYGTTTITQFGDLGQTRFVSPFQLLLPYSLSSGHYGDYTGGYAFPNVSDYDSTFIEEFAVQANTFARYDIGADAFARAYHIEFRIQQYSPSQGGSGSADYAFDEAGVLAFLYEARDTGAAVYFNESYVDFKYLQPSGADYVDGQSWSDYNTRLVSVSVVPEPSTLALLSLGVLALLGVRRRV